MNNKRDNIPFATRRELVIAIALACLNMSILGLLLYLIDGNPVLPSVLVVCIYLIEIAILGVSRIKNQVSVPEADIYDLLGEYGSVVFKNTNHPMAAFDNYACLLWCNEAMLDVLAMDENPIGKSLDEVFGISYEKSVS